MSSTRRIALFGVLAVVALGTGAAMFVQRQTTVVVQAEILVLQEENRELRQLKQQNAQLAAVQPSPEVLATLRADHAAVMQLRGQVEQLKTNVAARERALPVGRK